MLHFCTTELSSLVQSPSVALMEIVTFSSVHDIYCFSNIFNRDQVRQNKGPDQDQNCFVL